ncbi:MAG: DUF1614 domain-containing protein [Candidatus Bathyarchaeia archaeon]
MSRRTVYFPHSMLVLAILLLILVAVVGLVFVGVVGVAFADVGFSPIVIVLILVATFVGSFLNIPILKLKASVPIVTEEYVSFFGVMYRIPQVEYGQTVTLVAVNAGGALIPAAVSIYLLSRTAPATILYSIVGVAIVGLITHAVARPVKGVGIVTPAFIPPIAAAIIAIILQPGSARTIAYVAGVLGTLIGADLTNLHVIPKLGAPVASIGGAGTFDGVFLSGIIAVLLAGL